MVNYDNIEESDDSLDGKKDVNVLFKKQKNSKAEYFGYTNGDQLRV